LAGRASLTNLLGEFIWVVNGFGTIFKRVERFLAKRYSKQEPKEGEKGWAEDHLGRRGE